MNENENLSDHDLLITIRVEMRELRKSLEIMQESSTIQVADHESRIRRLEWFGGIAVGGLLLIEFFSRFYK